MGERKKVEFILKKIQVEYSPMETREGNFFFRCGDGDQFRLHIRVDVQGHRHLTLLRKEVAQLGILGSSLPLLHFFLENPNELLLKATIQDALNLDDFDKSLSELRKALDNDDHKNPRFIETVKTMNSYRFLLDVIREGELGIEAYPRWRTSILFDLLKKATRGEGEEDLRIVTVAFGCGIQELGLDVLLKKDARIKIILMNPNHDALLKARHGLRGQEDNMTPEEGKKEIERQIDELKKIAKLAQKNGKGLLQLKISNAMPAGFVAHSRRRAVVGLFLAQCSYSHGPMIEVQHDTEPWQKLFDDWKVRWESATEVPLLA